MATSTLPAPAVSVHPKTSGAAISLVSPMVDLLTVGGLSLIIYVIFTCTGYIALSATVITMGWVLNYFVNFPHFSATYVRAYENWGTIKTYYGVCLIAPLILLFFSALALWQPDPWAVWFGKAYLISVGYHYSGQTYGIALIFAAKAKVMLSRAEKYLIMAPIYASYGYLLGAKEVYTAAAEPLVNLEIPPLMLPIWFSAATRLFFGIAVGVYVVWNLYRLYRRQPMLPTICHVVVGSQLIWLGWGASNMAYNNFVPLFHCMQYLLITTFFYFRSVLSGSAPMSWASIVSSAPFWRYYLLLILLGAALFQVMQRLISGVGLAEIGLATAVVFSFVNLHHFIMDGRIWRLRKPEVRQVIMQQQPA